MTDAAPKLRAANIPPTVRIIRLRSQMQRSALKLDAMAIAVRAADLPLLADELKQEAAAMDRAARAI
jgi:hypothetical protein